MPSGSVWLLFALGAALAWGAYGPVLHQGQMAFGDRATAGYRAILWVGIAYFVLAIVIPTFILGSQGKLGIDTWTVKGCVYSGIAGVLGALGAFFITGALLNGGKPFYVMPLVFCCAPIINVIVSAVLHPPEWSKINPLLYVGLAMAAGGALLVLRFKPA